MLDRWILHKTDVLHSVFFQRPLSVLVEEEVQSFSKRTLPRRAEKFSDHLVVCSVTPDYKK